MPIFEYRCKSCGKRFEAIVQSSTVPECPRCESKDLDKELSVFAVGGGKASTPAACSPCGTCNNPDGPGSCQRN